MEAIPHIRTCPSVLEKIADVCTNRSRCRCCKQGQKCSKSCHKGKRCTYTEGQVSTDDAIEISDLTPSPKKFKHTNTWLDIENYTLTIDDRDSITNGEWLNDNHINAAQSLLKTKFPNAHVQGLQHANYATTLTFEVVSLDCVQIINMCKNPNKIIASLLSTSDKSITVNHIDVQRQSNTSDCGVLAIAFATAICHGIDLTAASTTSLTLPTKQGND